MYPQVSASLIQITAGHIQGYPIVPPDQAHSLDAPQPARSETLTHTIPVQKWMESSNGAIVGHLDISQPTPASLLIVTLFPHGASCMAAATASRRPSHTTLRC